MKTLNLLIALLIIAAVASSCEKETGPAGPAGPAGTKGANGNANVSVFGFGEQTFTTIAHSHFYNLPISDGMADSSLILPYYADGNFWFQAGEIGHSANYLTRYYIAPYATYSNLWIKILDVDGSDYSGSDITWDSVRVFVIPANIFRSAQMDNIDFKNQNEVSAYFDAR
ncbi:MAG TPA: hypothetical protein PKW80_01525 [Bacteroidales bacterium]|nr:hypothetical protein [Bacteroidales bacterium]